MSLILSRYECGECGTRHANGSKAQARCERQRFVVSASYSLEGRGCTNCRLWPAWTDARCTFCGTSPKERGQYMQERARASKAGVMKLGPAPEQPAQPGSKGPAEASGESIQERPGKSAQVATSGHRDCSVAGVFGLAVHDDVHPATGEEQRGGRPIFVPLAAEPFDKFERGTKEIEIRQAGSPVAKQVFRSDVGGGHPVILSRGYSGRRLCGTLGTRYVADRLDGLTPDTLRRADLGDPASSRFYHPAKPIVAFEVRNPRPEAST
jgi:hypothetical protein